MDINYCYKGLVPFKDYGKKEEMVGVRVSAATKTRLERLMAEHDRTMSYIANSLLLRGLALYEIDGELRDTQPVGVRTATVTLKPERKTLAPVVARIEPGRQTKADVRRMLDEEAEAEIQRRLQPKKRKKA